MTPAGQISDCSPSWPCRLTNLLSKGFYWVIQGSMELLTPRLLTIQGSVWGYRRAKVIFWACHIIKNVAESILGKNQITSYQRSSGWLTLDGAPVHSVPFRLCAGLLCSTRFQGVNPSLRDIVAAYQHNSVDEDTPSSEQREWFYPIVI